MRGFQLTEKVRIPADIRADYDNAMRLLDAKQYDQGIALLLKVTQKAPNAAAAYVDLGIAYGKSGDLDKSLASLKRAVDLNPRQLVAYNELGIVYRRKGEFAAARESYERALASLPRIPLRQAESGDSLRSVPERPHVRPRQLRRLSAAGPGRQAGNEVDRGS